MAMHQPCCLEASNERASGRGRCSGLPPKADACPDRHLCLSDADCRGGAKCVAAGGARTCNGAAPSTGPAIPGECMNAAPGAKLPDSCSHPR
jgi:hypothetical protein